MGENRTEEYNPCLRAHRDMIICSVKVIGQKQFQSGVQIILTTLYARECFFHYSNTPTLQYSFGLQKTEGSRLHSSLRVRNEDATPYPP